MPPATRCTSHTLAALGCAVLRRNLGSSWQQHSQGLSLKEAVKSGMWGTSHPLLWPQHRKSQRQLEYLLNVRHRDVRNVGTRSSLFSGTRTVGTVTAESFGEEKCSAV